MPQKIRMWEVTPQNTLSEVSTSEINLEQQLEDWLESDISMLSPDLLVIGRQVQTDFGGWIDLLCLDSNGDSVIVELKKGKTPREVTTQALDYASWVKDLSFNQITDIAEHYAKLGGSLSEAFMERFEEPLPDTLNQNHRSIIVAEAMDESTERIVRYLSDMNVPINVATVQHFKNDSGRDLLAQVFLVEPERAATKAPSGSKRNKPPTLEEFREIASQNDVGVLYDKLFDGMNNALNRAYAETTMRGVSIQGIVDGKRKVVFRLTPSESNSEKGLFFFVYAKRIADLFGLNNTALDEVLPTEHWEKHSWPNAPEAEKEHWGGYEGYFRTTDEIDKFLGLLKEHGPQI